MKRALVVDDIADNRYLIRMMLEANGYEVEEAAHGAEALARARINPPSTIVSDLLMPVMDGYTLLMHWKADKTLQNIPFIVYTATYTDAKDEELALNLGADGFIVKPAQEDAFLEKFQEIIARRDAGRMVPTNSPMTDEMLLLKEYSETLIHKLEQKNFELERSNRRLAAREAHLLAAINHQPDGVILLGYEGNLREINPAGLELLEVATPAEAEVADFIDFVAPADRPAFGELTQRVRRGETGSMRLGIIGRKDSHRIVELHATALLDPENGTNSMLLTAHDVTKGQLAETRLRESEERTRQVIETAQDAIITMDPDGLVTGWNQRAEVVFGWPSAEVLGTKLSELIIPEDMRARHEAGLRRYLASGESAMMNQRLEFRALRRDGTLFPVELTIAVSTIRGQKQFSSFLRDLSAEKEAERRIREQSELLDQASESIIVTQLDGCITFWNKGATNLYGWSVDETLGRNIDIFLGEPAPERIAARKAILTSGVWRGRFRITSKSGATRDVETSYTLIRDDDGQPAARLSITSDITEKKSLEEQAHRAQRVESIGMLAAGIAHDLNNVLVPVLLTGPLLRPSLSDPNDINILDNLEKSAERGAALVRQILGFAHGISGDPQLLQLTPIAMEIVAMASETFPRSISFKHDFPTDLWAVSANPSQLHQVLLNLCVNARDAMPKGGTLTLKGSNVQIDEKAAAVPGKRPGPHLKIEVGDTGTGITDDVLTKIWDPFFTTKPTGKGTGLGLTTCRGIVHALGGIIELDTEVGRGTIFKIFLPAIDLAEDNSVDKGTHLTAGQDELILLVDDETNIREIAAATLEKFGYRTLLAGDGVEAVQIYTDRAADIDLVITDLNMPHLDGMELARVLRQLNPTVKIVVASGLSSSNQAGAARQVADAFIPKPFTVEELLKTVRNVLDTSRTPST